MKWWAARNVALAHFNMSGKLRMLGPYTEQRMIFYVCAPLNPKPAFCKVNICINKRWAADAIPAQGLFICLSVARLDPSDDYFHDNYIIRSTCARPEVLRPSALVKRKGVGLPFSMTKNVPLNKAELHCVLVWSSRLSLNTSPLVNDE